MCEGNIVKVEGRMTQETVTILPARPVSEVFSALIDLRLRSSGHHLEPSIMASLCSSIMCIICHSIVSTCTDGTEQRYLHIQLFVVHYQEQGQVKQNWGECHISSKIINLAEDRVITY